MTRQDRVEALHERMAARRRMRERRKTSALAAGCAGLAMCLMLLIFGEGTVHRGGTAGLYTGAAMLFEGAGPYVLLALFAFMAGVAITVFCIRRQKKNPKGPDGHQEDNTEETP